MSSITQTEIFTTDKLATLLGSNKKTIERHLREGKIKGYKKLGKWYVLSSDLIDWIQS